NVHHPPNAQPQEGKWMSSYEIYSLPPLLRHVSKFSHLSKLLHLFFACRRVRPVWNYVGCVSCISYVHLQPEVISERDELFVYQLISHEPRANHYDHSNRGNAHRESVFLPASL